LYLSLLFRRFFQISRLNKNENTAQAAILADRCAGATGVVGATVLLPADRLVGQWIPYNRISNNLKRAIIASEDSNFSEHEGVDWDALQKAYEKNIKKGKVVAGGSTITQQLAKNLFLSGERSYLRKGQEVIITYMLEYWMDKERIFEIYLNVVEWGVGVFGAEAASQHYYGVSAAQLSAAQAARLAVMLPNPRFYDAHRGTAYLARRTDLILRRMNSAALP
jgi:monofunctional biosynthetic peptidoglycan transglycosylase